jgi:putative peptidoglycan lipid II flippase
MKFKIRNLQIKLQFVRASLADSTNRKIFRAAFIVGSLGILAKAGIAAKELIVAQSFGRSDSLDAFLIAFLLPSFVMNLLMGALGSALIPVLIDMRRKEGNNESARLLSSLIFLCVFALSATALLLALCAPWFLPWLGSSFSPAKLLLTRQLLYALAPFVVFGGIAVFLSSVLNADEKFALPALVPLFTPLITIIFVVSAGSAWGPWSLAVGTVAGSFVESSILMRILQAHGIKLNLKWSGLDAPLRRVLEQYAPMLAGAFLMGATSVVDQAMAAMLSAGSVSALSYANKITTGFLAISATALGTAALPYFSKMVAESDWQGCAHTLKRYTLLVAAVTIPFTFLLVAFATPLIKALFQRGAFTSADTQLVSHVLICYSLQIPFYVCSMLLVRFLSAMRRNDLLMYAAIVNLVLDIVLNLVLMRRWGIAGIALSTSLVYAASFLFVGICSWWLLSRERFSGGSFPASAK